MKEADRTSNNITIKILLEPYRQSPSDTLEDYYVRYTADESRTVVRDGRTYYKALRVEKITAKETFLTVALPAEMLCDNVSLLVDENGAAYKYKGIEQHSFYGCLSVPSWYNKIVCIMLEYSDDRIGEYFAVLC